MANLTITFNKNISMKQLKELNNVKRIIISMDQFSMRSNDKYSLKELKELIEELKKEKVEKEIYVSLNQIIQQNDLEELSKYLEQVISNSIDGIIFSDLGVLMQLQSMGFTGKTIYSTDTTITNVYFTQLCKNTGISEIELAKEITLKEIKEINEQKLVPITVFIHGHIYMYHSYRKLITTYKKHLDNQQIKYNEEQDSNYFLYDDERKNYYPIYEDNSGTHIVNHQFLCGIKYLKDLNNVDYLKIDSFGLDSQEYLKIIQIYNDVLNDINNIEISNEQIEEILFQQEKEIKNINNERIYSTGFMNKKTMY